MDLQWLSVINSGDMVDDLNVTLVNNIVMPEVVYFQQIPVFCGLFDGNNKSISGIVINFASDYTGMFACLSYAILKDLTINLDVTALTGTTGGIIPTSIFGGSMTVTNCLNSGTIIAENGTATYVSTSGSTSYYYNGLKNQSGTDVDDVQTVVATLNGGSDTSFWTIDNGVIVPKL